MSIEKRYIEYLYEGYSYYTVKDLLPDLHISELKDYDAISAKAQEIFYEQNKEIWQRNTNRSWVIKVLDTLLWALTIGHLRLLERDVKIDSLMKTAYEIRNFILNTPLRQQTWRKDYPELIVKLDLEETAKKAEEAKRLAELQAQKKELKTQNAAAVKIQRLYRQRLQKKLKAKGIDPEDWMVKTIKEKWLDDISAEAKRIREKNIIPEGKRISSIFNSYDYNSDEWVTVIGRALEIKQAYQSTHYVFSHGQSLEVSVINDCLSSIIERFIPEYHNARSIPFRLPFTFPHTDNVEHFSKKYKIDLTDFVDNNINDEIISVDAAFWNNAAAESALYFLSSNKNINMAKDRQAVMNIFKRMFINYLPDELCTLVAKKAQQIASEKMKLGKIGNFYVICVPKKVVENPKDNYAYRSHPFGRACDCFPKDQEIDILEKMQNDENVVCKGTYYGKNPQYRLLASRLFEDDTVRSFSINALKKEHQEEYSKRAKDLVRELALYSALYSFSETSTEEEIGQLIGDIGDLASEKLIDKECVNCILELKMDVFPDVLKDALNNSISS